MAVNILFIDLPPMAYQQARQNSLLIDLLDDCIKQLTKAYQLVPDERYLATVEMVSQKRSLLEEENSALIEEYAADRNSTALPGIFNFKF